MIYMFIVCDCLMFKQIYVYIYILSLDWCGMVHEDGCHVRTSKSFPYCSMSRLAVILVFLRHSACITVVHAWTVRVVEGKLQLIIQKMEQTLLHSMLVSCAFKTHLQLKNTKLGIARILWSLAKKLQLDCTKTRRIQTVDGLTAWHDDILEAQQQM